MRHVPVIAIGVSLVLSGCGGGRGGGGSSQEAAVKSAWRDAVTNLSRGDPAVCNDFTGAAIRKITSASNRTCPEAVKLVGDLLGPDDRAAIAAIRPTVTVHGDDAEVHYHLNAVLTKLGFTGTTRMRKSGGRWLVAPK